ncbi:MAG: adenosylmethionine decarboxylase [Planctomyces sp.]|jgi:S-adenosylmethionine decarboxylase|nr:adenosylmethionine decarboxylase [Planctomyces sp.]
MEHLGQHVIIELWGCNSGIDDADLMKQAMLDAVKAARATLLYIDVHKFDPQGVTGVAVLTESHLSVHSWPEHGYLAADVFTCGNTTRPVAAAEVLCQYFQPTQFDVQEVIRGVRPESGLKPSLRKRKLNYQPDATPLATTVG